MARKTNLNKQELGKLQSIEKNLRDLLYHFDDINFDMALRDGNTILLGDHAWMTNELNYALNLIERVVENVKPRS